MDTLSDRIISALAQKAELEAQISSLTRSKIPDPDTGAITFLPGEIPDFPDLEPLLREALATLMNQWQPIETAPKGDLIIVTGFCFGDKTKGRFVSLAVRGDPDGDGEGEWVDDDGLYLSYLTHWAPLPAPPKGAE